MDAFDYAAVYDRLRAHGYRADDQHKTHLASHAYWIRKRLDYDSVLDVGCSTGGSLPLLADVPRDVRTTGVDVSRAAVHRARSVGRDVRCASATALPFGDQSFDLVVSSDTLEHIHPDDVSRVVDELARVSRRWIFLRICTREDQLAWKELVGHPLHLTIQPLQWWISLFSSWGRTVFRRGDAFCLRRRAPQ